METSRVPHARTRKTTRARRLSEAPRTVTASGSLRSFPFPITEGPRTHNSRHPGEQCQRPRAPRAGVARAHSLGFLPPSLAAGSWCTSTPAPPRSSTTRRPRVQHIWRITSVFRSSAVRRPGAVGKSQSCGPRVSAGGRVAAGREVGGGGDLAAGRNVERAPPRDLLGGLCSIAAFLGSIAAPPLSGDGASASREARGRRERAKA